MTKSNIVGSSGRHVDRRGLRYPAPLRLNSAMTDANDEALLRRLVGALAPVPGIGVALIDETRGLKTR
jgi:hypothetical protein